MHNLLIQEYGQIKKTELEHNPYYCLSDSDIDINPHQIEAFSVAVASLKSGGVILADEVGLGKTIEAGLVIKYVLHNGAKRILLIMPSNLRKQWQIELGEKFSINTVVVDSFNTEEYYEQTRKDNNKPAIVICSYNYASNKAELISRTDWDFVVFDEAHKLRNIHKSGVKIAKNIYEITKGIPKIMLTATPLQNNLLDLYGLVYFIDEKIFFDKRLYAKRFIRTKEFLELKTHIKPVLQRTLRKDVADYISFKQRVCITVDFKLSPKEAALYVKINDYLKKDIIYAIPTSNRNLITVVIRKLLASSSHAVAATFEVLKERLVTLKESTRLEKVEKGLDYFFDFLDDDYEIEETSMNQTELYDREKINEFIQYEINVVEDIIKLAVNITKNAKANALMQALNIAFQKQRELSINEKVVVFTESIRTQEFLYNELVSKGYIGEVLLFNGNPTDKTTTEIYKAWKAKNFGKPFGSRNVETKHAIVDYFKNNCKILLVTDAGSEGLNLQFCNSVINYDLPWNPQKIEQRIGRCHRYGQKNDTIVINLLNTENVADKRVYEILSQKFELFEGVFGASDQALGLLESGMDFEKRIMQIYQKCNSIGEFNKEFKALEKEFERKRNLKFQELKNLLSDGEEVHPSSFKNILVEVMSYLDEQNKWKGVPPPEKRLKYPAAFEVNIEDKNKYGLNHGYIFMGALYNNQKFKLPFLCVYDDQANKIDLSEGQIIEILESIRQEDTKAITIDSNELVRCGDSIYNELILKHYNQNKAAIDYNKQKIDNWSLLRKDYFNLEIGEIEKRISELKEQALATKNFKEKINFKKQAEAKEKEQDQMIIKFHQSIAKIDEEASQLINDFGKQFEIDPVLFAKVVAKF
jgi:ERCC4-related helicase